MIIHAKYLGRIREIVGKEEESFVFKGGDVGDFFEFLFKKYGKKLKEHMEDKLAEDYAVLVNGHNIGKNLEHRLRDGDDIIFMPLVIGG